jgi:hypothetical protein
MNVHLSVQVFLWRYSPCGPWPLFTLLFYSQSVGFLGRVISWSQGLYLKTGQHKRRINTHTKHPCPEWDSSPRSQRPIERKQFTL